MNKILENFSRDWLRENVAKLTEDQQHFFKQLYRGELYGEFAKETLEQTSVDSVVAALRTDKLDVAMDQVARTLDKNERENASSDDAHCIFVLVDSKESVQKLHWLINGLTLVYSSITYGDHSVLEIVKGVRLEIFSMEDWDEQNVRGLSINAVYLLTPVVPKSIKTLLFECMAHRDPEEARACLGMPINQP